jgi:hypothetical protein
MKKELSATERRLNARNDRIYQLEQLVTGQEHKLNQREQRYNEELAALKRQVTLGSSLFSFLFSISSLPFPFSSYPDSLSNTLAGIS